MKLRPFLPALLIAALALSLSNGLRAAEALPVFNATLAMGRETRFLLQGIAGKTSPWLKVGDSFDGYVVKAYDAKAAALDLERDGKVARITLVSEGSVTNAPAAPTPATLADATALMNKIHLEDVLERAVSQQRKMIGASVGSIGKNFPNAAPEDVATLEKNIMDMVNASLDPVKMKEDVTKIYSETFSKDELDQISAFYDTPFGQVMLAKQPEVQAKMQTAMMQSAGQIGPKIQKMARDFAIEQKTKMSGGAAPAPAAPAPKP